MSYEYLRQRNRETGVHQCYDEPKQEMAFSIDEKTEYVPSSEISYITYNKKKVRVKSDDEVFKDWFNDTYGYGYGTGEKPILTAIMIFLGNCSSNENHIYSYDEIEKVIGKAATWMLISVFCKQDLVDYGTSPRFAWLTEKGKWLLNYLKGKSLQYLYSLVMYNSFSECSSEYCNCVVENIPCITNPLLNWERDYERIMERRTEA